MRWCAWSPTLSTRRRWERPRAGAPLSTSHGPRSPSAPWRSTARPSADLGSHDPLDGFDQRGTGLVVQLVQQLTAGQGVAEPDGVRGLVLELIAEIGRASCREKVWFSIV